MNHPQITLLNETEPREIVITTGVLYRFEKQGGNLAKTQEIPITTMVDLVCEAIKKEGENKEDLIEKLPPFGQVSTVFAEAMEAAGMGESSSRES